MGTVRAAGTADLQNAYPGGGDPVLDQALARIGELACRLHDVQGLHSPRRTVLGARVCRCCRERFPCATAIASRRTPSGR